MSVLTPMTDRLVDRLDAMLHPTRDWNGLDRHYGRKLTKAEYDHHIRHGSLPRERKRQVRLVDESPIIRGRVGVSDEATALFTWAQAAGGRLNLTPDIRFGGVGTRVEDLERLVAELAAFNLARLDGGDVVVEAEHTGTCLWASGWSRWSPAVGAVRRAQ
jgi:hypothetical protein